MVNQRGFSLLELCTVILILSLVLFLAIPSLNQWLMQQERIMTLDRLEAAIEYAKQMAFIKQKPITLCSSINRKTCEVDVFSLGFIVVELPASNGSPPNVLHVFPKLKYGRLHFQQFGTFLTIQPNGRTINNGTFIYCPKDGNQKEGAALIINQTARTYRPTKKNALGVILIKDSETGEEKPLTCR